MSDETTTAWCAGCQALGEVPTPEHLAEVAASEKRRVAAMRAQSLEAENARLRERVAELEGALVLHALPLADGLPCWCAGGWLEDGSHGAACLQSRAALAQAEAKDGPTIEWGDA